MRETAKYVLSMVVMALALACLLALASCGPALPRPDSTLPPRVVQVPIATACVREADIAPEPAHPAVPADARAASSVLAATDLRLRAWGRELAAMLRQCAKP
jgi:hypothetical protein